MAAELRNQFKLDLALRQGMLPIVWAADDRQAILEAYNGLYLREEVQMEGLVRNIGSFARFLEAMSFAHAAVDFVVYGDSGLYAVEVRSSRQLRPEDLRALHSFGDDYPQSRRFLLYRGKERLKRDDILCLPCEDFLLALTPGRFPE